jgi:peptidoglycan/xylan/chitin deacetylase (PgdA/CDA1 family)
VRRLGTVAGALLAVSLALPSVTPAQSLPPNELGRIMILEYHKIDDPENRWTRTPENFRRDLETLYSKGYRAVNLGDVLDRRIKTPQGTTPVVFTFDDSSPGQFRYVDGNGGLTIDAKSAVGILDQFSREHPDFGRAATFFVLPGASKPNRLFNQPEFEGKKLQYLVSQGYEIGNHTLWHANLGKYDEATVRTQIAEAQQWIQRLVPDYRIRTIALPHGVYPKNVDWAMRGSAKGTSYSHDAILMVAGGPAMSPFDRRFEPTRLPRVQAVEADLTFWLRYFDRNPQERFVSDGDPATLTVPAGRADGIRREIVSQVKVIERQP